MYKDILQELHFVKRRLCEIVSDYFCFIIFDCVSFILARFCNFSRLKSEVCLYYIALSGLKRGVHVHG